MSRIIGKVFTNKVNDYKEPDFKPEEQLNDEEPDLTSEEKDLTHEDQFDDDEQALAPEAQQNTTDLASMTIARLTAMAAESGIAIPNNAKKADIIAAIEGKING